jgi:integrase/recombinase XerC
MDGEEALAAWLGLAGARAPRQRQHDRGLWRRPRAVPRLPDAPPRRGAGPRGARRAAPGGPARLPRRARARGRRQRDARAAAGRGARLPAPPRAAPRHGGTAALAGLRGPRAKAPVPARSRPRPRRRSRGIGAVHDPDRGMHPAMQAARDVALFTLLYGCGLRIAEALGARPARRAAAGREAALRVRGKGDKEGWCRCCPRCARRWRPGWRTHPDPRPDGPLFVGARGARLDPAVAQRPAGLPPPRRPAGARDAACAAPFLRDASARRRRRAPSRSCAAAALLETWRTCARSRNCSAMPACPPRSATPRWTRRRCSRPGAMEGASARGGFGPSGR